MSREISRTNCSATLPQLQAQQTREPLWEKPPAVVAAQTPPPMDLTPARGSRHYLLILTFGPTHPGAIIRPEQKFRQLVRVDVLAQPFP